MFRLVLREIARWVRGVGAPLTVLAAVVVTPSLVPGAVAALLRFLPGGALSIAWMAALAVALTRLIAACVGTAHQLARDERAAEHLQRLRDRSALPHHALVCVLEVLWTSRAGQRVAVVDTRTGKICELWFAEHSTAPGTFALLVTAARTLTSVDEVEPTDITAAHRHEQLIEARLQVGAARASRRESRSHRTAAAEVIRAAERLLR